MIQHTKRHFSPREQTHLARFTNNLLPTTNSTAPVEYLTGKAEFCDFVLSVQRAVLIPRIETEELVELVTKVLTKHIDKQEKRVAVLEVGTGSGAITIALARQFEQDWSQLRFVVTDISQVALTLAQKNSTDLLNPNAPITFLKSDLLKQVQPQKFDIIIANLPYIPSARIAVLDKSVRDHEPRLALDGGPGGFELIARLLDTAGSFLAPNATIFLEIDHTHTMKNFLPYRKLGWQVALSTDQANHTRFAVLSLPV